MARASGRQRLCQEILGPLFAPIITGGIGHNLPQEARWPLRKRGRRRRLMIGISPNRADCVRSNKRRRGQEDLAAFADAVC